jgi:group I intron endonuclease
MVLCGSINGILIVVHYIYVIRNSVDNRAYVGQTTDFAQRKAGHVYSAKRGDHRPLYQAMREFGVDQFSFDIIEECNDPRIASQREEHWVTHFDSFNNGFNLTQGGGYHVGNKGRKFTEEHKKKISEAHKGKIVSDETRKKIGEASRDRVLSEETKRRIGEAQRRRQPRPPASEETKQKLSDALKGRSRPDVAEKLQGRELTDEHKAKIAAAGLGRRVSEETRRKMSEAAKNRKKCD